MLGSAARARTPADFKIEPTGTLKRLWLLLIAVFTASTARPVEAQTWGTELTYEPNRHYTLAQDFPRYPWPLGDVAPGMHFEELYAGGHYTCRYDRGDEAATCYLMARLVGPDSLGTSIKATVDRRTGTVLTLRIEPSKFGRFGHALPHDILVERLAELWGTPDAVREGYREWVGGECANADCAWRKTGTRISASLRRTENRQGWEVYLASAPVQAALEDADLDRPRSQGWESRRWYPAWNPLSFEGLRPGMSARRAASMLGSRIRRSWCELWEIDEDLVKCELGRSTAEVAGLPMTADLAIDSAGRAMQITLHGPRQPSQAVAERQAERIQAALAEAPGTATWSHPFSLDVAAVHDGLAPAEWWVMVTLSTEAAEPDVPDPL